MVPLARLDTAQRLQAILRSVDYAIVDVVEDGQDVFALANYLWTIRRWELSTTNSEILVAWARNWLKDTVLERHLGERSDEQLAAAALATVALYGGDAPTPPDGLIEHLGRLLRPELERSIPLGQPSYAAAALLAATTFGIGRPDHIRALEAVRVAYLEWMPDGRLFGLALLVRALIQAHLETALNDLLSAAGDALPEPEAGYENIVHLAEALCEASGRPPDQHYGMIADVVEQSPLWSHILVGQEDIPEIGDRRTVVQVSHLVRAALASVTAAAHRDRRLQLQRQVIEHFRGHWLVTTSAFLFFLICIGVIWALLIVPAITIGSSFVSYFVLQHYASASAVGAFLVLGDAILASYVLPVSLRLLWTTGVLMLRGQTTSQGLIIDEAKSAARAWWNIWFVGVAIALVIGVLGFVIGPGVLHVLES